ncbi:hypothetical protein niasHS_010384 [Heterodera schachtii]|uniref:Uncharacterized protein n=1 Tax=Heterodera schachtii TaxID=97005 RepID=A0ABD2J4M3_HETSC
MRERRRQKILQNAEERISKILTAHGGTRQVPTLDGITHGADSGGETAPPVELRRGAGDGQRGWGTAPHAASEPMEGELELFWEQRGGDAVPKVAVAVVAAAAWFWWRRGGEGETAALLLLTVTSTTQIFGCACWWMGAARRQRAHGGQVGGNDGAQWKEAAPFKGKLELFWEQRGGGAVPKVAVAVVLAVAAAAAWLWCGRGGGGGDHPGGRSLLA